MSDLAEVVLLHPSWPLSEVKALSRRERDFWKAVGVYRLTQTR